MEKYRSYLPLHLQLFAEGDTADTEAEQTAEDTEQDEKTFTQAEVDKLIADRKKRWEAKNKKPPTEETEDTETLKTTLEEKEKELQNTRLEVEALKAGVPADKVAKFIKLAGLSEEEEIADRVKETLVDFPEFAATVEGEKKKKKVVAGGNPSGGSTGLTKEDIMAIKDPVERVEAISQHQNLFN